MDKKMDLVNFTSLMAVHTVAILEMVSPKAKEDSFILTVMSILDNGKMTKPMVLEPTILLMEQNIKANGNSICVKVKADNNLLMVPDSKVITTKVKKMVKVSFSGPMVTVIQDSLGMTKKKEKE